MNNYTISDFNNNAITAPSGARYFAQNGAKYTLDGWDDDITVIAPFEEWTFCASAPKYVPDTAGMFEVIPTPWGILDAGTCGVNCAYPDGLAFEEWALVYADWLLFFPESDWHTIYEVVSRADWREGEW